MDTVTTSVERGTQVSNTHSNRKKHKINSYQIFQKADFGSPFFSLNS